MNINILVVEDDVKIQELIVEFLLSQDYKVDAASDGVEGYEKFKEGNFDLIILDVMMPNLNGYDLCKMIRKKNRYIPIIFLTALGNEEDEIKGFDLEADDYITKPFSYNILIKRVEVILKRKGNQKINDNLLEYKDLNIDENSYKVYIKGEEIELTLKEFNILKLLVKSYPMVVTRELIIEKVWGTDYFEDTRVIDAHVKNLRKKINANYIKTLIGIGYVLEK
ncbi:response regulator transcription factor [Clostridium paraputrificum]|uniref:response regulator transcription factor n=1 Tax=Clostridium paraputrificum TaxID=29363 RepID=UPI003D32B215